MATIEISKAHFLHNLNQIALKAQSIRKIALVLKDNAYGHGLCPMAKLAAEAGIEEVVVRNLQEAKELAPLFRRILVLQGLATGDPPANVTFAINDLAHLEKMPPDTPIELKIDTGMHRSGIAITQIEEALECIAKRSLRLVGVMTHHRSADEMGSHFFWQRKRFEQACERVEKLGLKGWRRHSCNSAALFRSDRFDEDIARVGIAAYGCLRMASPLPQPHLKPVMRLWAQRIGSRWIDPSMRIGYGGEGRLESAGYVSTYDIGYGDGWPRGWANKPYRLPDGKELIGRVSMDMLCVKGRDERVLLFEDATEAARQFQTIPYEMMVRLSPSIPRVVV